MRLFRPGGELWLKQSSEEETPVGQIERTHFVARAARGNAQSGGFPSRHVLGIGLEITEILAPQGIRSAQLMHERALDRTDGVFAMHLRIVHLGSVGVALRQWTSDGRDHDILRIGIVFGGIRIAQTQHVSREFDQRVLESGASSEVRQVTLAGELNAAQHAARTAERAARRSPKPIEVGQEVLCIPAFQRFRGKPARFNIEAEPGCGVEQGRFGGPMGMLLGIEVA